MDSFLKRRCGDTGESDSKKAKMENCPHGNRCYRRNPHHFKEFQHDYLIQMIADGVIPENGPQPKSVYEEQIAILKPLLTSKQSGGDAKDTKNEPSTSSQNVSANKTELHRIGVIKLAPKGSMQEKLERNAPYNLFFTTIPESKSTYKHSNTLTFSDLLCPSLGELKSSLQLNFMIDIAWLMEQYKKQNAHQKPLTIVYGDDWPDMKEYIDRFLPNVKHHLVKMKDPFGCHHTKMGIYVYTDNSVRVVVSTANLYFEDWNHYNQGLWISPRCPPIPANSKDSGESPTQFKSCLLDYLKSYNLGILSEWIAQCKNADFSAVKVFFVASIPGKYSENTLGSHAHHVASLLSRYCKLPKKTTADSEGPLSWGVIAQCSSIGSMGKEPKDWLRSCILRSLAAHKDAPPVSNSSATLSIVYPSVRNVLNGYYGPNSGGCLPYSKSTHEKQKWLHSYFHQWKADNLERTRAMPHIKSYCRISPCLSKLAYFLLTSANLSKAAWGNGLTKAMTTYVRSYEAGVMFLPQFFDEEYFEIQQNCNAKNKQQFPFMYDLPLTEYSKDDYPYCT